MRHISLLVSFVYGAWCIPLDRGRVALESREAGAQSGWARWRGDVGEPDGVGAVWKLQGGQCWCAPCAL
jgi:hypothetical protein